MATPTPDIRVDWRADGFNSIANDSFATNTSGWVVTAGINAAGTSITRITTDGPIGGQTTNTCAELVTTGTNGSGTNFDFGTTTFTSGRTYRFRVWLKSVSGTTSAKILIGSLGTVGDRASATMTLTTSWVAYLVNWTPSGTRTDVEVNVTNNAASIMTARLSLAEVYESFDDISGDVDYATWRLGANFDGTSETPGSATLRLNNISGTYSPDNTGSVLNGLIKLNREVWIRASYLNLEYGCFAGIVRRIVPLPEERKVELLLEDRLWFFGRTTTGLVTSDTRSIKTFRGDILDDVGEASTSRNLGEGSPEWSIPVTGADNASALGVLDDLNAATDSIHFIAAHPLSSVIYRYTTIARTSLQTGSSVETYNDDLVDLDGWDVNDETLQNRAEVDPTPRLKEASSTVWTYSSLPLSIPASSTRTIWAKDFAAPVFSAAVSYTATGSPGVVLTPFETAGKIVITTGGSAAVFTMLGINGQLAPQQDLDAAVAEDIGSQTTYGRYAFERSSDYLSSTAEAQGLADWHIYRYADPKPRPTITVQNRHPSQLTRQIGDRIALTFPLLNLTAVEMLIRSLVTTVNLGAFVWRTEYFLERAPTSSVLFTLGGSADEGVGGTGVLAR